MREIKFRQLIWDYEDDKLLEWHYWGFWDGKYHLPRMNADGTKIGNPDDKDQQYTGLKDKNEKEIYEGDIVLILYTNWPSKNEDDKRTINEYMRDIAEKKVVQWSYSGFYVSHKIGGYSESIEPGKHGFIEVIGNIYENPELLIK